MTLQLGSIEKIERALVLYMVVAWRIARLMRLGRSCPDLNAQLMFEPDEWKAHDCWFCLDLADDDFFGKSPAFGSVSSCAS
ncbi:Mobile element protein [Polaromonas sp. CG9_12]|nr:Mobile element protein [Polaromonas sp. CG9_12]